MSAKKNKATTKKVVSAKASCKKSFRASFKIHVKEYLPEAKETSV